MYEVLHGLLMDQKGGTTFTCFGIWHVLYMVLIFGIIILTVLALKGKNRKIRQCGINIAIGCAFGLYIADFFLMPFAYGEIDLEKLPFHMCTAMCILCFLSRHSRFFGRFKTQFALLGLISNLIYVVYPAGIGWYQIHPLSYRAVQTLLFHGAMTAYGVFTLSLDDIRLEWKHCFKELFVIVAMTAWAMLGNALYNGTVGEYSHHFNWFFVTQDPFYLLPGDIAPYIMPIVMILVFFVADLLVYGAWFGIRKICNQK